MVLLNIDELLTFVSQQRVRNLDLKFGADWYRDKYVHNTGVLIQYATSKMQMLLLCGAAVLKTFLS